MRLTLSPLFSSVEGFHCSRGGWGEHGAPGDASGRESVHMPLKFYLTLEIQIGCKKLEHDP